MTDLNPFLPYMVASASAALRFQRADGSFPPGHNNSWQDIDTPVRVTSHFAIQLVFAYRYTQDPSYLNAARDAGRFLLSEFARPGGKTFFCRLSHNKNLSNGLIGQAWAIEALLHLYSITSDNGYLELAAEVYSLHPFDWSFGLYCPVDCDGTALSMERTLNHQLIFSAAGMGLAARGYTEIDNQLNRFYERLPDNIYLANNGLIHHHVRQSGGTIKSFVYQFPPIRWNQRLKNRSKGYQSFNLFALALAKRNHAESEVWTNNRLNKVLERVHGFAADPEFLASVLNNNLALAYRLTGQEILFFLRAFGYPDGPGLVYDLIETQFDRHWDSEEGMLAQNTGDPKTLSSRLYEMWYLFEDQLSV